MGVKTRIYDSTCLIILLPKIVLSNTKYSAIDKNRHLKEIITDKASDAN